MGTEERVDLTSVLNPGPRQAEVRRQCWVCFVLPEQVWNVWQCQRVTKANTGLPLIGL